MLRGGLGCNPQVDVSRPRVISNYLSVKLYYIFSSQEARRKGPLNTPLIENLFHHTMVARQQ